MPSEFNPPNLFIGPLPKEAYEYVAEQSRLSSKYPIVQIGARAIYGQQMRELALKTANSKLESRQIDGVSGVLSRDEWTERADMKLLGFELGRRPHDRTNSAVLITLDAEGFKQINDEFGHPEGDRVLGIIGSYLSNISRIDNSDLVGRLGGDEFAWLAGFDSTEKTAIDVLVGIERRLRDIVPEIYPGMPSLRWNHAFYAPGDKISDMLERADMKGKLKERARSHRQVEEKYRAALERADLDPQVVL